MNICTTTEAALAWLLSLSATCTSSPLRPSSPADNGSFTDWLNISPSPSPTTSSSQLNHLQEQNSDIFLDYDNGFRDMFNDSDPLHSRSNLPGRSTDSTLSTSDTTSTHQHQMFPLDPSTITIVNSPSPRSLLNAFLSPTTQDYRPLAHTASPLIPPMFPSPAINDLTSSPFGSYLDLYDPSTTSLVLPSLSLSDVSPVVRASHKIEDPLLIDKENQHPKERKQNSKSRFSKKSSSSSSFLEKLQSAPLNPSTIQQRLASPRRLPARLPSNLDLLDGPPSLVLLSPVKIPSLPAAPSPITLDISDIPHPEPSIIPAPVFTTPSPSPFLSPLSPLTPLSTPEPLKIKIILKRKNPDPSTPIRTSKRPRRTCSVSVTVADLPSSPIELTPSVHEQEPSQDQIHRSVYTNRTLPTDIKISSAFPLLYRRFPASTYYQPPDAVSPCTLFDVTHPGGNYNPPRRVFDLYTPRFVRGRGAEKVGLCPICIEPVSRGGENRRLWLAMKFSAFKCYHMQYAHGISASTGKPFSPPTAFRVVPRQNAGKNEKHQLQEGKCHKCSKWVVVEGVKDMESKVPELYWWKHAATCHHDSTLEGEGDYFEQDEVYDKLVSFEQPDDA